MTCSTNSTSTLSFRRGDSFQLLLTVKEADPTDPCGRRLLPVDLTTAVSAVLYVKQSYEDTLALFTVNGVVTNAAEGQVLFQFIHSHTALLAVGDYVYDVVVTLPVDDTYTVVVAPLELLPTVH